MSSCASRHYGPWAIDLAWLSWAVGLVEQGLWPLASVPDLEAAGPGYQRPAAPVPDGDGIVKLRIDGPMMRGPSKFGGCDTLALRDQVHQARLDPRTKGILLEIDSPGGMIAGTDELAREVASVKQPTVSRIESIGGSAAYWVASQTDHIYAARTAEVGSIGAMAVVTDSSGADEKKGYKVHVLATGPLKGVGIPGAPITEDQLSYLQSRVEEVGKFFLSALETGRKREYAKHAEEWKSGRVWSASEALKLGLIDGIDGMEEKYNARQTLLDAIKGKRLK
jgi:signal peptide peptidase SppA